MYDFTFCISEFNLISVSLVKHFFLLTIICGIAIMDCVWFSSIWESLSCWHQSRFLSWRNLLSLTIQNLCGVLSYIVSLGINLMLLLEVYLIFSSVLSFQSTVFFSWHLLLLLNFPRSSHKNTTETIWA